MLARGYKVLVEAITPEASEFEEEREMVLVECFILVPQCQIPIDERKVFFLLAINFIRASVHLDSGSVSDLPSLILRSAEKHAPISTINII